MFKAEYLQFGSGLPPSWQDCPRSARHFWPTQRWRPKKIPNQLRHPTPLPALPAAYSIAPQTATARNTGVKRSPVYLSASFLS